MRNLTIWFRPDHSIVIETWQGNEKEEYVLPRNQAERLHLDNVEEMFDSSHAVHFHKAIGQHNIMAAGSLPEGLYIAHLNQQHGQAEGSEQASHVEKLRQADEAWAKNLLNEEGSGE